MFDDQVHPSKRRKVRKGTQSCWECKRRKVRCIFASAEHAICNNCRRRGTACVSQELEVPGTLDASSGNQGELAARLGRVEEVLERLANAGVRSSVGEAEDVDRQQPQEPTDTRAKANSTVPRPQISGSGKYDELCRELIAAWPSDDDLEVISSLPLGLLCIPLCWRTCTLGKNQSPSETLNLPLPCSHPVLIARRLLMLATHMQGVIPSAIQQLDDLGVPYREIMIRAVEQAIKLVTTNDELITSVEGLECVMLEVMYQNYAGNLHRAWMAVKRATTAAQVMGLHRASNLPPFRFLDQATRATFDADDVCFRLVQMDHYLSLMLGLPQTALEGRFAIPDDLSKFNHRGRLERLHCAVSGRIVRRNDAGTNDLQITREADNLLQIAAAEMPPQWWLSPSFSKESDLVDDTIRLMIQFTHYHLLARLHLPYMLRPSTYQTHEHSKAVAVYASRELLSRYIMFRSSNPVDYYCRGCDFLAFVATMILCLAHINSSTNSIPVLLKPLAYSRPTDRGMMEQTAEIIASTAAMEYNTSGAIAPKLTRIIRHLLDVESSAASGTVYSTSTSPTSANGEEGEIDGTVKHGGNALHIRIPYYGTIRLERGRGVEKVSRTTQLGQMQAMDEVFDEHPSDGMVTRAYDPVSRASGPGAENEMQGNDLPGSVPNEVLGLEIEPDHMFPDSETDWNVGDIDIALFDSLFRGIELPEVDAAGEAWM
ncbi:putative Zn(II)2Cys6 transcription factor [Aspergillus mulundensis]|uniref:Putative Zn(II)2Cys6 transcription factor n=1 Tax=Aspergillus mulundensis TaxID=1810919 RepID=A0A3D8SBQ0_9EURO|nr:putative Zn(II)2Cys6 transcription factor [Aspergillus mulundensis]RDW83792.1 putative Zn(II)2Cys6 transcription factor [Aspergillus mulundensis]